MPNDLLLKAKVDRSDVEFTRELERKRAQGDFILANERPMFRKIQEYDFDRIASETAARKAEKYFGVFTELGIDPETNRRLQEHLSKIHKASLEAESSISQVTVARKEYDKRVRALLSDEDYARYREFEMSTPAWAEVERIQALAGDSAVSFDPSDAGALANLINESQAVEDGWWHGPYDPLPQPKIGRSDVTTWSEQQLSKSIASRDTLISKLANADLSASIKSLVVDYYNRKIEQRRSILDSLTDPAGRSLRSLRDAAP